MNTANLQLEGLYVAVASILSALREKGLLTEQEIERALAGAEDIALADQLSARRSDRPAASAQCSGLVWPTRDASWLNENCVP